MSAGSTKITRQTRSSRDAFVLAIVRSIRGTLGRFLAIMGIVALGCGFFAGLQMAGEDMRLASDAYYDGTSLWDLRVISTLGFGDEDIARLKAIEGVQEVMPSTTCDAMVRLGGEQIVVRISSLDVDKAQKSEQTSSVVVTSADDAYLNRPLLVEGRWPMEKGECVVSADKLTGAFGVGDTVEVLGGNESLDDLLENRTLTIVGTVSSPNYPYTGTFGLTTLGSGKVDQYLFVCSDSLVEDAPYTEAYLLVDGASECLSESEAYESVVSGPKDQIEDMAADLAKQRQADLKKKAQDKLDDAKAEYDEQHAEAYGKLDDARQELDDAAAQIEDGRRQLEDGVAEYEQGYAQYQEGVETYNSGEQEWADGYSQMASRLEEAGLGGESLDEMKEQLADKLEEANAGRQQLEEGISQAKDGAAQARAGIEELQSALEQVQAAIDGLNQKQQVSLMATEDEDLGDDESDDSGGEEPGGEEPGGEELGEPGGEEPGEPEEPGGEEPGGEEPGEPGEPEEPGGEEPAGLSPEEEVMLAELEAQAGELTAKIAELETTAEQADALAEQLSQQLGTLDAQITSLQEAQEGIDQLIETRGQLDSAATELENARGQLAAAADEIASSRALLDDAEAEYKDGMEAWRRSKREADEKFADARQELDEAQQEIDDIELGDVYVLDRSQSEGAATYHADSKRIDSIADVFPFMFFLVAALVALTTMTRMVEDERQEIGMYKALGYGTARIASRYLAYASAASVVGAALGIAVLSQVLPFIIMSAYSIIYTIPAMPLPLPIDPAISLVSGGMGVGVTLAATWFAVVSSLRETPATLMLPRAPAAGKRILLERITPLWRRFSFSWKVTFRNLFRYKRRFFMTVIGVSGCTALLLVGFGLHDSIWDIIDRQFGPIIHYDTTIGLDDDATSLDVDKVAAFLSERSDVSGVVRLQQENMRARGTGSSTSATATTQVNVIIPQREDALQTVVTFKDRVSGTPAVMDKDAVLVTEKLASLYGIEVGGQIILYDVDDVGNPVGDGHSLTVTGIVENYVGNTVYIGRSAWRRVSEKTLPFSTLYCSVSEDEAARTDLSEALHTMKHVSTVVYSDETINMYRNMLSVVDMVVVVLIVSAGALAFIVLYNLTNINIGERIREIASLKVLGFTRTEVYAYIFREIALLALLGDMLGMVLGTFLERFVVTTAEVDYVMFGRVIHPESFLWSFVLTMVFTAVILLLMRHKLDRVSMVESLKSVD